MLYSRRLFAGQVVGSLPNNISVLSENSLWQTVPVMDDSEVGLYVRIGFKLTKFLGLLPAVLFQVQDDRFVGDAYVIRTCMRWV